jgi:hypothetical protein
VTNNRLSSKKLKQVKEKLNLSERHTQLDWAPHNLPFTSQPLTFQLINLSTYQPLTLNLSTIQLLNLSLMSHKSLMPLTNYAASILFLFSSFAAFAGLVT